MLIKAVSPTLIPVDIQAYVNAIGGVLKVDSSLPEDQSGFSICHNGKHYIVVNGNDSAERQRFTACHELGHIVLDLPSTHGATSQTSRVQRPENEIFCDIFAAELLLPHHLFVPLIDPDIVSFAVLDDLATRFQASVSATGSRFSSSTHMACAFVFSDSGKVRYASRSKSLREMKAWIPLGMPVPSKSASHLVRSGHVSNGSQEIAADEWFSDWTRGGALLEEARHLKRWDQTLTLLWFDGEEDLVPERRSGARDEELEIKELDGVLPWPGKKRRKR